MTTQTTNLRLILPVQGEFTGTWGDQVNAGLTNLLDTAIAGTTTLISDADVTLTAANYVSDQARAMILLCTGARTALRNINAPLLSKVYVVLNATSFGVTLRGVTPTTGVTIPANSSALCAWNGSDFAIIAANNIGANHSGVLPVSNGGTGVASLTGLAKGNGAGVFTAATAAEIVAAIGATAVANATNATNSTNSTNSTNATNLTGSGTITDTTTINGVKVGYRDVPQLNQAPATAITVADAGKHFYASAAGTWTIPANASQAFPIGAAISFVNLSGGACSIAITTDTMTLAGIGTTGTRTLANTGIATALKVAATAWIISGSGLT